MDLAIIKTELLPRVRHLLFSHRPIETQGTPYLSQITLGTMEAMILLLAFLAVCTLPTALALDCVSCISVSTTDNTVMNFLQREYGENFDFRCANNPTDITRVIPCSGSCMNINVTTRTAIAGLNSQPIVMDIYMRTCNPVTSIDDGCKDLTDNDMQNVQQFVGAGVALDNQIRGRYCVCNKENCNNDISTLGVLPTGKKTQCHSCRYMEYVSSDPQVQQNFDEVMARTPGLDIRCRDNPDTVPYISCNGSCMSSEGTVNMTFNNNDLKMYLVQRQCASVRAQTKCSMFNEDDDLIEQLLPVNSLKAAGVTDMEVSLGYCACSLDDCNGGHTSLHQRSSASTWKMSSTVLAFITTSVMLCLRSYC